jgi:hypothetical protein
VLQVFVSIYEQKHHDVATIFAFSCCSHAVRVPERYHETNRGNITGKNGIIVGDSKAISPLPAPRLGSVTELIAQSLVKSRRGTIQRATDGSIAGTERSIPVILDYQTPALERNGSMGYDMIGQKRKK